MPIKLSPIALFVYNRLDYAQQTIDALRNNFLADESELFIFSDAPKNDAANSGVSKVREYIASVTGFKAVNVINRSRNLGPSESIVAGVSELVNQHSRLIVLDDDLVTGPYFLKYMNDGLNFYENQQDVISICGYMYPVKISNRETFFLRIADNWGWATWKRGWSLFEPDANLLLKRLKDKNLVSRFDLNGAHACNRMLKKQAQKKISSWAIRWYASALLNEKLSLYPFKSLVRNIGLEEGSHCSNNFQFDTEIFQGQVSVKSIPITEDKLVIKKVEVFFRMSKFIKLWRIILKKILFFTVRQNNTK